MFAGKLAGLMNPLSTMDCENECDSLFLIHGFPLQSGCAKIEPLLFYTGIYRFTERFIYIYIFFTFILFTDLQQRFTDQLGEGFLSTAFFLWILLWKLPGSWLKPSGLGMPIDTEALQLHQGGVVQSDFQGQLPQINQQVQPRSSLYLWKSQLPHPFLPRLLLISMYSTERSREWKGAECEDGKIRLHMQWQQWVSAG